MNEDLIAAMGSRTGPPAGIRVLVVDDNEDLADVLDEAVTLLGHVARVAHTGEEALQVVNEFAPQLALVDVGLPDMDGYELVGRLRALPGMEGLRIVAVTGYGQGSDRERSKAAGCDLHLVKPVELGQLEALLEEMQSGTGSED
jgi:CheY-like chemotaxis protein